MFKTLFAHTALLLALVFLSQQVAFAVAPEKASAYEANIMAERIYTQMQNKLEGWSEAKRESFVKRLKRSIKFAATKLEYMSEESFAKLKAKSHQFSNSASMSPMNAELSELTQNIQVSSELAHHSMTESMSLSLVEAQSKLAKASELLDTITLESAICFTVKVLMSALCVAGTVLFYMGLFTWNVPFMLIAGAAMMVGLIGFALSASAGCND